MNVDVGGNSFHAAVQNGRWSVQNVQLPVGSTVLTASLSNATHHILITRAGNALSHRPQQKVRIRWNNGVDSELKLIATGTLDTHASAIELQQFVDHVKQRTPEVFASHYEGVADVKLVTAAGPDVHTIDMLSPSNGLFGQSPFDCGSLVPNQTTQVFVGTYRDAMVNDFVEWGPMSRSDALSVHIEDVAQALGRTAAHETGHSLGLVGEAGDPCSWMNGCDGGHDCDQFDAQHPDAIRFDSGWFIMDPGPKTVNRARIAEPDANHRTDPRSPAVFNAFNRSYFRIVHPSP